MADDKPTSTFYRNLGGINQKASEYSIDKAQFLYLSNVDFDVPNALSKRPGSTQAIGLNASGPINSLFEFVRLDGSSYVIAGDDSTMRYKTGTSLTLLDAGWTNGQPTDMLTFLNKVWMANGQKFSWWSGSGSTVSAAGLPVQKTTLFWSDNSDGLSSVFGASIFLVAGATHAAFGSNYSPRAVFFAYSYLRSDGYWGPTDFLLNARNIVRTDSRVSGGGASVDFFGGDSITLTLGGFTIPTGIGISAVALWVAVDSISTSSPYEVIPGIGTVQTGSLGWKTGPGFSNLPASLAYISLTLKPTADLSRFYLFTTMPSSYFYEQQFPLINGGATYFGVRVSMLSAPINFNSYNAVASGSQAYTGMLFSWFETNAPKYIEVNQNVMFMSGLSGTPSNVWFSDLGQPEMIQPDSVFEVRTNDGDRILATKTYANQLIVMKENSFHKVIGDSAENFELVEVSTRYGCLSNKTVIEYEQRLVWLDKKGILEYNGANYDIISTPVEDIFRRMNVEAAKEKAVAVHEIYRNQIWFGIPIDGSTQNNMTVVYDYLVKAWTFFEGFNAASFAMIKQDLSKGTVWRGSYSGMIYYHGASFLGDNGQGITCLIRPHWDKNKENETWIWRRFFSDVATVSGLTGQLTGKVFSNYDNSTVQATFAMYQDAFQSRAEIGVPAKSVTVELAHYSASLPLLFNGYSWAKRFLRNV